MEQWRALVELADGSYGGGGLAGSDGGGSEAEAGAGDHGAQSSVADVRWLNWSQSYCWPVSDPLGGNGLGMAANW